MRPPYNSSHLVAAGLLLAALVVGMFVLAPARDKGDLLSADLATAQTNLGTLQSEVDRLRAAEAKLPLADTERQKLLLAVPVDLDQDQLILDLKRIGEGAKVSLNAISFSLQPERYGAQTVSLVANFTGRYEELMALLLALETNSRLFRVNSIGVQLSDGGDGGAPLMNFSVTLEAYYQ